MAKNIKLRLIAMKYIPILISTILIFSLSVFAQQSPKSNSICDDVCITKIQSIIDNYRKRFSIPGLQVALSFANQPTQVLCSGSKTIDGKNQIEASSLFEIGSTTKSFSAAIVLQLVREGKIRLDDTIDKWFGDEYPVWRDNTVNDLLDMTSTTFDYFDNDGGIFEKVYWQNPTHIWTTKELNDFCYQEGPNCTRENPKIHTPFCAQKPGKGWSYSNTNYILLERIAEKASGKSFSELMRRRILEPLHLTSAVYDPEKNPATIKNFTNAYHYDPTTNKIQDVSNFSLSAARAAGAIIATTEDLAKWVRALFSGKVLATAEFERMTRVVCMQPGEDCQAGETAPPLSRVPGYSCGLMRFPGFEVNVPTSNFIWAHTGGSAGHGSIFVYDIKNNFVLAAMQNVIGSGNLVSLAREIDLSIFSKEGR
jgi:D-alanyl-D-alanine carboxypeptidase